MALHGGPMIITLDAHSLRGVGIELDEKRQRRGQSKGTNRRGVEQIACDMYGKYDKYEIPRRTHPTEG